MDMTHIAFMSAMELKDERLLVAAYDSSKNIANNTPTLILVRSPEGDWSAKAHTSWLANGGISSNVTGDRIALLSPFGRFTEGGMNDYRKQHIIESGEESPTEFRFLKVISGSLYAGGTNRFLFRDTGENWEEVSSKDMHKGGKSFDTLTGFNPNELYGFGWSDTVCTNVSGQWKEIKLPLSDIFHDSAVFNNKVYAAGQSGTIIEGRGDEWRELKTELPTKYIISICTFKDAVYFSTFDGIFSLTKNNEFKLFAKPEVDYKEGSKLFTGPSGLWLIGDRVISLFDGQKWKEIYS